MAAGAGILAFKMGLEYSTDGVTYTELEDIKQISSPGDTDRPEVDITPIRMTTATARKFRKGLVKGGTFSFEQFYSKTRMTTLQTIKGLEVDYYWRISPPDGSDPDTLSTCSHFVFTGQLKKAVLKQVDDPENPLLIECEVVVNSDSTFTAAA